MGSNPSDAESDHLEAAWRALRHPAWPGTLAETMKDPARAHLIRGYARTLARSAAKKRKPAPAPAPRCAAPAAAFRTPAAGWIDRKRAAAGDRDDD